MPRGFKSAKSKAGKQNVASRQQRPVRASAGSSCALSPYMYVCICFICAFRSRTHRSKPCMCSGHAAVVNVPMPESMPELPMPDVPMADVPMPPAQYHHTPPRLSSPQLSSPQLSSPQPSSPQPSSPQPSSLQPSSRQPSLLQPSLLQPSSLQPSSLQPSSPQSSSPQPSSPHQCTLKRNTPPFTPPLARCQVGVWLLAGLMV